jgi:tRNA-dihydrouridine synthase
MNKIIEINKVNLTATVEPYVVIGELNKELDKLNLFFPPDPSNLAVSTVVGAVALNAGGPRTFKYGNTKDYVINLEVVLADGTIIERPTDEEIYEVILKHIKYLRELKGDHLAMLEMRGQVAYYLKGLPHSTSMKKALFTTKSIDETLELVNKYFEELKVWRSENEK